ncbi:MAG: radical SAM protein, partial [Bdellovibrionales bacterium]|nr:radical SAM protein [Bdellovibrionales bacterium]
MKEIREVDQGNFRKNHAVHEGENYLKNYYEVEPEESQFYTIGVDVTHRCNMECANCYSPIRHLPDVDQNGLIDFFRRLGRRTEVRLTGGEPTLREDLPVLIEAIAKYGHRPAIMTNGLKLSDRGYCKTLKEAGLKFVAISLNGADDDEVYQQLDHRKCARLKMLALKNIIDLGFFLNINCILVRGISDHIPLRLAHILKTHKVNGVIRFRNIGKLGRYMENSNLKFNEMIENLAQAFGKDPNELRKLNRVNGYEEEHNILFPLEENKKLNTTWIKVTDWRPTEQSIPDPKSTRRGRMTKTFKVAPF